MAGTRINSRRRADAGNRARDAKWGAVMENKNAKVASLVMGAAARMKDVSQQKDLQRSRNIAAMALEGRRGDNAMRLEGKRGVNVLNQISRQGDNAQSVEKQRGANAVNLAEKNNIYSREKDNRNFVTQALTRGVPMDAQAQNAYNTPGSHDIDINGMQVPQKQAPAPKQIYVQPQFDKEGNQRPGTGIWALPPGGPGGKEGAVSALSRGFDPMQPTPEDEAYLRNLAATGQFDLLQQIEAHYNLGR